MVNSDQSPYPHSWALGLRGLTKKFRPQRWTTSTIPKYKFRPDLTIGIDLVSHYLPGAIGILLLVQ